MWSIICRKKSTKTRTETPYIVRIRCLHNRMILNTPISKANTERRTYRPSGYSVSSRYEQDTLYWWGISGRALSHDRRISSPMRAHTSCVLRVLPRQSNLVQYPRRREENTHSRRPSVFTGWDGILRYQILLHRWLAKYYLGSERDISPHYPSKMPRAYTKTGKIIYLQSPEIASMKTTQTHYKLYHPFWSFSLSYCITDMGNNLPILPQRKVHHPKRMMDVYTSESTQGSQAYTKRSTLHVSINSP